MPSKTKKQNVTLSFLSSDKKKLKRLADKNRYTQSNLVAVLLEYLEKNGNGLVNNLPDGVSPDEKKGNA